MFNVNNTYIRISGCIINVLLSQDGEDNTVDITYTVINNSGRYLNGVQLGYSIGTERGTIFTASTIGINEQRGGHAIISKGTVIWNIVSTPQVSIIPSSGYYNNGDSIVFSLNLFLLLLELFQLVQKNLLLPTLL